MVLVKGGEIMPQICIIVSNGYCGGHGSPVLETILKVCLSYHAGRSPRGYGRMACVTGGET